MKALTILDKNYTSWVKDLCERFRVGQIKAAVKVNREMLAYYWNLGKDIAAMDAENKYGSAFYGNLPLGISEFDLAKVYPEKIEGTIPTIDELEQGLLGQDKEEE